MAGTMSGLLTWTTLLGASFLAGQLPSLEGVEAESLICRSREGWTVQRRFLLLAEEQFQEAELRRVFGEYLREPGAGELYVLASSDPDFFRARNVPGWEIDVYLTEAPVAYFFRLGGNAFFQYGRMGGPIQWVVLEGENVLRRRFGRTELWWVGHLIATLAWEEQCEEASSLRVAFVSPEVHEEDLDSIARYHARLARHWENFGFYIYSSFERAARRDVWFASLEAMPSYMRLLSGETLTLPWRSFVNYTFARWHLRTEGYYLRYDKEGFGPAAWKKRVILEDPDLRP
jgi:hypothetical protein